jgi:hypothetical protein
VRAKRKFIIPKMIQLFVNIHWCHKKRKESNNLKYRKLKNCRLGTRDSTRLRLVVQQQIAMKASRATSIRVDDEH